jgi:pimeloyl-ACP methyl ester carboxylesterase
MDSRRNKREADSQDISRRSLLLAGTTFAAASAFGSTASAQTPQAQQLPPPTNTRPAVAEGVVPFTIQVPDAVLADLKTRLAQARFADEISDANWDYGTNLAYLKSLVDYWRDKYDWRARERQLNQFDQFKTTIDGVDIHFIHQRSKQPNARPLLLLNGWPSSIVEYTKVIGPLTDPGNGGLAQDSFHLVIPSMPGYGFSGKPRERGYDTDRIGRMWVQLMARLGYPRYAVHGSDWGNLVATRMALDDAAHVTALHLEGFDCVGTPSVSGGAAPKINAAVNSAHNSGYQDIQSTKPQAVGHALSDSPVGLASWILDKWYTWSDHDGDLEKDYTKDDLLTNIMIYWVTNSGASSARLYYENRHVNGVLATAMIVRPDGRVTVSTGCGGFPSQYDRRANPLLADTPDARKPAEARYNLVDFKLLPRGGHFPALEQPTQWMDHLRAYLHDQR